MKIAASHIAAAYEFLRALPPFKGWALPPRSEISFEVLRTGRWQGDFYGAGRLRRKHRIRVSAARASYADRLLVVTAHEMVHLRVNLLGKPDTHGPPFKKLAREVCDQLGFDPLEF